ncbi:AAA family ATPase [Staphylococcus debuckii]|uniref:AAA family ATPase n=1 Tax=Staphylococcus debuckii TaxID=2044912 RepID=UPI0013DEE43F|nr:AAA family ATPase [Staphylococcus debuckii]
MKTIIKYGNEKIDFADSIAKDKNQEYCPTCFRPLGDSDKNEIRRLIKEVLEKNNTETLENRIEHVLSEIKEQELIKIDDRVDVKTQSDLNKNIGIFNYYVKKTVEILEEKRRYPYKTKFEGYCVNDLKKTLDKLKEKIEIYEQLVITYNSSFKELSIIQDKATELNIKLASIKIKDKLTEYKEKENLYNNLCVENKNLINEKEIVENRIDKNIQELKKTNFALKEINDNLKLIFYDDNRLKLVNQNNKYYIKSRGKYVKSNELSLGEQNVISLCYFFSTINKDRSIEDVYRHEMLLVLDDPISSFDYENKIGIYNFLRMKLKRVCRNNEDSKIIITTHDMEVLNNLEKLVSELKVVGKKNKTNLCLLNSNGVQPMKNKFKDQYKNQLRDIYSFAKGENDIVEQYIGNEMRKVLEAFSTFNFQCGMDDLRRSDNGFPLSIIKDDREKEFFESFMFRLVLNNESHSKDTVNNYTDQNFYQYLTLEEKVYTAKMQIVFMYKLNPYHIAKTIGESFSEKDIKKWSELIK